MEILHSEVDHRYFKNKKRESKYIRFFHLKSAMKKFRLDIRTYLNVQSKFADENDQCVNQCSHSGRESGDQPETE